MKCLIILFSLIMFGCKPDYDCKSTAEDYKFDQCLLIISKLRDSNDNRFDHKGVNLLTKKQCDCNSYISDRWWSDYNEYITVGDTIIKRKGELTFSIHKKDTVLSFNFECDGKVYK